MGGRPVDGQSRPPKLWYFVPVVACSVLNSAAAGVTGAIYSVLLVPCIGIAMKQFLSAPSSREPIEQVAGQPGTTCFVEVPSADEGGKL